MIITDRRNSKLYTKAFALLLMLGLLSNSILAAPEATRLIVVSFDNFQGEMRSEWQRTDLSSYVNWPLSVFSLFTGRTKVKQVIDRIEIQPSNPTVIQGESIDFSAIAVRGDESVNGVGFRWTMSDTSGHLPTRSLNSGHFSANRPGTYVITAIGENQSGQTTVIVRRNEAVGVQRIVRKPDSERTPQERALLALIRSRGTLRSRDVSSKNLYSEQIERELVRQDAELRELIRQRQQALPTPTPSIGGPSNDATLSDPTEDGVKKGGPSEPIDSQETTTNSATSPFFSIADDIGWDGASWSTADDPGNRVGHPLGSAPDDGASNGNFDLSVPLVSLPGRGLNVNLSMTYNSRTWNKLDTVIAYDADKGYPAPGWNLGFGRLSRGGDRRHARPKRSGTAPSHHRRHRPRHGLHWRYSAGYAPIGWSPTDLPRLEFDPDL